jgi:hypothetical protein
VEKKLRAKHITKKRDCLIEIRHRDANMIYVASAGNSEASLSAHGVTSWQFILKTSEHIIKNEIFCELAAETNVTIKRESCFPIGNPPSMKHIHYLVSPRYAFQTAANTEQSNSSARSLN